MTVSKRLTLAVLCIALVFCTTLSVQVSARQNAAGGFTYAAPLSNRAWQWFADEFGSYTSMPNLLHGINNFGIANFRYTQQDYFFVQTFYPDRFLFEVPFEGVCYEFACFVKSAVLVWAEENQVEDVKCFVYSVKLDEDSYHAVNFIYQGEDLYYIDITTNTTRAKEGGDGKRILKLGCTIDEYIEKRGWELVAVH